MLYLFKFCELFNINYLISSQPHIPTMYEDLYTPFKHKEIIYGDSNSIITDMYGFLEKNKLRISDETNGFIDDNHGGYIGNKKNSTICL